MAKAVKLHGLKSNPDNTKVMTSCAQIMDVFGYLTLKFTFSDHTSGYAATDLDPITYSAFLSCLPGTFMTIDHGKVVGVSTHTETHFAPDYKLINKCPYCHSPLWFTESGPRCTVEATIDCRGRTAAKMSYFCRSSLLGLPGFDFEFCLNLMKKIPNLTACSDLLTPDFCLYQGQDYIPKNDLNTLYMATQAFTRELLAPDSKLSSYRFFIECQYFKALQVDGVSDKIIHTLVSESMGAGEKPLTGVFDSLMDLSGTRMIGKEYLMRDLYREHERLRRELTAISCALGLD